MEPQLPYERKNALGVFLHYLPVRKHFQILACNLSVHHPLLPSDFIAFSSSPFHAIPRDDSWDWCQSGCRSLVKVDNVVVSFRKLNARKKRSSTIKPPALKLWLFEARINQEEDVYFVWCENGIGKWQGVPTVLGTIYPQMLMMEDFGFLAPFMDETNAKNLGLKDNLSFKYT